jgi:hypothetical protein
MNVTDAPAGPVADGDLFDGRPQRREALLQILRYLDRTGYRFVTATPGTHARVLARSSRRTARDVRDVLGWSLPFAPTTLPGELLDLLETAGAVSPRGDDLLGADVRVSSVDGALFLHSAYPTLAQDAVFLGPDSYRFADLIAAKMATLPAAACILDYAAGAGVGGIVAARRHRQSLLVLADINSKASFLSSINADFAGLEHRAVRAQAPREVEGSFDLIVTHPPFMMDDGKRAYRDGGDLYGARLSIDWALEALGKLNAGGKLVLHTGISIVNGRDVLIEEIERQVRGDDWTIDYHELDPDIFSEDLDTPPYVRHDVERIAAVGLCITRTAAP